MTVYLYISDNDMHNCCFVFKVNKLKLSTTEEGATNGVPASSEGSQSKKQEIGSGDAASGKPSGDAASGKPPGDAASGKPPDTTTVDGGTATEDDEKSKLTLCMLGNYPHAF